MQFNNQLINILESLKNIEAVSKTLRTQSNSLNLTNLLKITPSQIILGEKYDLQKKISHNPSKSNKSLEAENIKRFIRKIGPHIKMLNHVGIGYACSDFNREIDYYKTILVETKFKLYEESSNDPNSRWFFVGDTNNWKAPLFEIVLTKTHKSIDSKWNPQFQIDLDTNLTHKDVAKISNEVLGKNIFDWKLDIPNYGTVLLMGRLGNISGVNLYLGIGTNLRDTKLQRRELLKPII